MILTDDKQLDRSQNSAKLCSTLFLFIDYMNGGSVAEWLACWTQAQKGLGSNRGRFRVTVLGKLFTPIVPLITKQQNW